MLWGAVAGTATLLLVGVAFLTWHSLRARSSNAAPIRSIAVLPFGNASKDPDIDYLSDGLSGEITNSLSRLPDLRVMARSTVSHYRSRSDDPQGVGHDLHVDAVMTGRVIKHGSELDVETELVDVTTGAQLWGKRYTRSTNDASLLQPAITRDIATQLRPQISGNQRESLAKLGTKDAEAYRFYLKGRHHFEEWRPENLKAAAKFFEKAVDRDPKYAAAYAGLADVYVTQGYMGFVSGPEQLDKARSAAQRALALDSHIPEPHTALANLDFNYFWNFPEAEAEVQKALEIDPNSAYAHEVSCWVKAGTGKTQEGLAECRRAVELDPLSVVDNAGLAVEYYFARDYTQAVELSTKTLDIDPKSTVALNNLGNVYEQMGDYKQAMEQWIKLEELNGHQVRAEELKRVFMKSGYPGYLRKDAKDSAALGDYYQAAEDYAVLGQKDAAFAALQKAFVSREGIVDIYVHPRFDKLRADPRFADLVHRIGLPQ